MFPELLKIGPYTIGGYQIGPLTIYSFGVLMAVGFYVGSMVSVKEYERRGGSGEALWSLLVWVFLIGLASSRILSIFNNPEAFMQAPVGELLAGSGFVWYGGFLGGALAAWLLGRRNGMSFITLADCCAPGLAIGQAFGRIGCHVSGDGDWGSVTTLPWGVAYSNGIAPWEHPPGVVVHPTPLYEAAAYFAVFALLWQWRHRNPPLGAMFAAYLIGNGFFRFLVEFIRVEPVYAFGLTQAQLIGLGMTLAGIVWLVRLRGARPAPRIGAAAPAGGPPPKGAKA
jgi:phosphatidylglycerol---prolipoprotein diacylglyceryl transferase